MGIRELITKDKHNRTQEAIINRSLGVTMEVFEHLEENGAGDNALIKLGDAPNDIDPKQYYEGVCAISAELVENRAPRIYAGKLVLDRELTHEKSLTPVALGSEGWRWDVLSQGATLVFTPPATRPEQV